MRRTSHRRIYQWIFLVNLGDKKGRQPFNITQVKPVNLPSISEIVFPEVDNRALELPPLPRMNQIDTIQNAPPTGYPTMKPNHILITELIHPLDLHNGQFDDAKRQEIEGIIKRGTFKLVLREELGPDPNIIPFPFFLAIKQNDDGFEI
jgi:hypothetical protein